MNIAVRIRMHACESCDAFFAVLHLSNITQSFFDDTVYYETTRQLNTMRGSKLSRFAFQQRQLHQHFLRVFPLA